MLAAADDGPRGHTAREAEAITARPPAYATADRAHVDVLARANVPMWNKIEQLNTSLWARKWRTPPGLGPPTAQARYSRCGCRQGGAELGVLADAGFSHQQRVVALRSLTAYLIGALLNTFSTPPLAETASTVLAELSPDEYPNVISASEHASALTPEHEFGAGLALLVAGLAANAGAGTQADRQSPNVPR